MANPVNLDLFGGPERPPGPLATPRRRTAEHRKHSRRPRWWHMARPYARPEEIGGLLAQIAEAGGGGEAGLKVALDVAEAWGGTKQYVPQRPDQGHPLVAIVGWEAALAIGTAIGGNDWPIPNAHRDLLPARRRLIRELHAELRSVTKVALELGIGEPTIREAL
ncbi:MAG: hypothetical protein AB1450_13340 [Pseudomonadota bacterium]